MVLQSVTDSILFREGGSIGNSIAVTVEKRRHLRSGERREDGMLVALRGLSQRDGSTQAKACHSYELYNADGFES